MSVVYSLITGHPSEVVNSLRSTIGAHCRHHNNVKIGITDDPETRLAQHKKVYGWIRQMVVIYKTTSDSYVREIERHLIDHAMKKDYVGETLIHNQRSGGGGRGSDSETYYVYIIED